MSIKLQKSPRGLLELLDLKQTGHNPPEFGELVAPSIDVTDFYAVDRMFAGNFQGVAGAFPRTTTEIVTVGPIRYWGVAAICEMGIAGGTQLNIRVGIRTPGNDFTAPAQGLMGALVVATPIANFDYVCIAQLPSPILLPTGSQIQAVAQSDAAGADHLLSLRYLLQALS